MAQRQAINGMQKTPKIVSEALVFHVLHAASAHRMRRCVARVKAALMDAPVDIRVFNHDAFSAMLR
jgi:hypothetical protein